MLVKVLVKRHTKASRQQDYLPSWLDADGVNLLVGTVAYVAMMFLHPYLIGVSVM